MSSFLLAKRMAKVAGVGESRIRRGMRLLTTSSLSPAPYMLLSVDGIRKSPGKRNRDKIANFNFYSPMNQTRVTLAEQRIPESIYLSRNIGSSRGWVIRMNEEDLTVHVTNMFNPSAPKSTHRIISLPMLLTPYYHAPDLSKSMATYQVRNVSLSSSPDNPDQECILAVKFWGSFVSYCSIRDGQWRHELSLSSRASKSFVFYSNNDVTFYLTPPVDTFFRKDGRNMPEPCFSYLTYYRQAGPLIHPKMGEYEFELLRRCTRSKHLVESPSGDLFIIVKYALQTSKGKPVFPGETRDLDRSVVKTGTRWFMLYMRHPTTRVESYVQDIGDLCIFLGRNEPFCVPASMYPGLKPNSIYFFELNQVYLYNIPDQTFSTLSYDGLISDLWIQPILHKTRIINTGGLLHDSSYIYMTQFYLAPSMFLALC
ncbi:uncharacterized protein LOC110228666 [Arabidopsis lyrata subsp. lyrata]|uniref:uncharacterized protein LOC110228666 n=1 Tax=Arabidopsis lyrata subsp. lyrata TaxID=81972 RepID=UPI000A29CD07|nr:uncharacterized protein LOC110228666 [Arabidopsis lyrata subsp. lyrata]|eukprot:XP_020882270.1 uncharacterized protein LOC110228666 [Arabidopsis lyrata subsp. lyrata]